MCVENITPPGPWPHVLLSNRREDLAIPFTLTSIAVVNTNKPAEIENNISNEISKITTWLHSNKLKLNASKSKFMIFFKHPKIIPKLNIWANGNQIDEVQKFNFLGITIDQNITWTPHIRKISIKISRVIGVLRKLKHIYYVYSYITSHI